MLAQPLVVGFEMMRVPLGDHVEDGAVGGQRDVLLEARDAHAREQSGEAALGLNQIACDKAKSIQQITNQMKMLALNALIEADRVVLLSGNAEPIAVPTPSGKPHEIYRCSSCRVALWSIYGGVQKLRFVRVGTLDDAAALKPDVHIYVRSKLPWVTKDAT